VNHNLPIPPPPRPEDQDGPGPHGDSPRIDPAEDATPQRIAELIEKIRESADNLAKDHTSRGDLKILSRTLRELRYAFKVFSPYRHLRKVTVFGSARTAAEHASYRQAVEFGRQMAQQQWLVVTGAASGIMEAGHVGAGREHSMGLNILLPFEQSANRIIAGDPPFACCPADSARWMKVSKCSRSCKPASATWCRWSFWTNRAATIGPASSASCARACWNGE
jgi:hypothetical protein